MHIRMHICTHLYNIFIGGSDSIPDADDWKLTDRQGMDVSLNRSVYLTYIIYFWDKLCKLTIDCYVKLFLNQACAGLW